MAAPSPSRESSPFVEWSRLCRSDGLQRGYPLVDMRTDRFELTTIERPEALDAAKSLAIPLSSVLVKHRVAVVTPQRSNHGNPPSLEHRSTQTGCFLGHAAHHIVARTRTREQAIAVALVPLPDSSRPAQPGPKRAHRDDVSVLDPALFERLAERHRDRRRRRVAVPIDVGEDALGR